MILFVIMGIIKQKSEGKGSLKDIQLHINKYPTFLNKVIIQKKKSLETDEIVWFSPLEKDDFSEYRDGDLLNCRV